MRFESIPDVHDCIMTRLFVYPVNSLVYQISPLALEWADKRRIGRSFEHSGKILIVLPENYHQYLDWSQLEFHSVLYMDVFASSLDLIQITGWQTTRRKMIPFTLSERDKLREMFSEQAQWMT